MDLSKTGNFIQECRKAKKLTQVQLAQKIGVSEKTISKWECGNGFPDTTLMLPLCRELGITANELLSAKRLYEEVEYKEQAEANLVTLKNMQEKSAKFLLMLEWVIGILSTVLLLTTVVVASLVNMPLYLRIILIVVGTILSMVGIHFCLLIEKDAGYYECGRCHHKYIPTYCSVLNAMHVGRTRYMKCPNCNKRSWQKKTINKEDKD
ncbi:MAG: helix-turn-helix transcriptional regulator [Clostridia bacterium]|nr:helix-turn-helix transcriptional regulator [Clostridia bacterium]